MNAKGLIGQWPPFPSFYHIIIIIIGFKAFAQAVLIAEYFPLGQATTSSQGPRGFFQVSNTFLIILAVPHKAVFAQFQHLRQDLTFPYSY